MSAESEAAYVIPLPEERRLALTYSRERAEQFRAADAEAHREIEAARLFGQVVGSGPPLAWRYGQSQADRDRWFEACYGCSERELIEAANAAVERYVALARPRRKRLRAERRRAREEALEAYIRAHVRLSVSHGLTTVWR
jgi:uncharacterized protein with von Willebrand factor type A (vWA) domain